MQKCPSIQRRANIIGMFYKSTCAHIQTHASTWQAERSWGQSFSLWQSSKLGPVRFSYISAPSHFLWTGTHLGLGKYAEFRGHVPPCFVPGERCSSKREVVVPSISLFAPDVPKLGGASVTPVLPCPVCLLILLKNFWNFLKLSPSCSLLSLGF